MQALVKTAPGPGHLELCEMPEPAPAENQVKLEVSACGICGTDLHIRHDTFRNYPPVITGHEFVGRVVEEGAGVRGRTDRAARYAVLGATALTCGRCRYCRSGDFMFCPTRRGMGHGVNGAFARYACVRPDQLFSLGAEVPEEEGALVEPLAVAVRAVIERSAARPGDVALISGPGPIGLLCLLVLCHLGIKTIVAGTSADAPRLALARALGAIRTVDVQRENLAEVVQAETDGIGADLAYETSGAGPSVGACLDALRPLGRYVQVGHFGREVSAPLDRIAFKQLDVLGCLGYSAGTWERTVRLLGQGLRPSRIVTHRLPLARWSEGFDIFERKEAAKVLLQPA